MDIYVLRHGQTDYNVQGRFQGQVDIKLNEKGIEQAREARIKLGEIKFEKIISSPLNRARQTAKIATDGVVEIDERIIERSFGKLEGKKSVENYEEHLLEYNIEPMESLFKRVYQFLDELIAENKSKIDKVLLVTHEGIAQIIQCYFEGIPTQDMKLKYRLNTGEFKKYSI